MFSLDVPLLLIIGDFDMSTLFHFRDMERQCILMGQLQYFEERNQDYS